MQVDGFFDIIKGWDNEISYPVSGQSYCDASPDPVYDLRQFPRENE